MKKIAILHLGEGSECFPVTALDQPFEILREGCRGDLDRARALIEKYDGQVDVIGLEDMPAQLRLGDAQRPHLHGSTLRAAARRTPLVDGSGVRAGLERWGVILADRLQPGIFSEKNILLVPGLNHEGLAQALGRHSPNIRYADPLVYFALPTLPGVGSRQTLDQVAGPTLDQLKD
ncbi:MAG: serine carboxypeptidase, partial [Chloroflexota bacterium]